MYVNCSLVECNCSYLYKGNISRAPIVLARNRPRWSVHFKNEFHYFLRETDDKPFTFLMYANSSVRIKGLEIIEPRRPPFVPSRSRARSPGDPRGNDVGTDFYFSQRIDKSRVSFVSAGSRERSEWN